jgi:AcrR family transcriptional regulator
MTGLRERKKERTRAQLIDISQRLFREQGYDATTLEQIAAEAELSVATVLTYFESKERLWHAPEYVVVDRLRAEVQDPDRTEPTVDVWRRYVAEGAGTLTSARRARGAAMEALRRSLQQGRLDVMAEYEQVLLAGLAADRGVDPALDLEVQLLATTLAFSALAVLRSWLESQGAFDLRERAVAAVDLAVSRLS